jgi:hypothetical protein
MKIIAVNITKTLASGLSVLSSTERAWVLNISNCSKRNYVIGIKNGKIEGFFKKTGEHPDSIDPKRVAFILIELDASCIINCFNNNPLIGLKGITTKYIDINCNCQDILI